MIAAVTVMFVPAPAAQADGTTVVDPDTTNAWSDIAASSTNTQNIGRIWTDKSVFDSDYTFSGALDGQTISKGEDSDFLVSLSALSSTSNTTRTVTVGTPVDIVLVLDESGSMEYGFDNRNTRREALQEAANKFIDSANEANQGVPQENQIRMSIVTFSDDADVARGWTYVTGEGTQSLHDTIGDLNQYGATRTDLGLSEADGQLASARQDAQKIVILFTDGDPSGSGLTVADFDCVTAKDAVNTAKEMKDDGATVYTIGIFSGANPNTDNRSNNFLNAVSSNFPTATAEGGNGLGGLGAWFNVTWGEGSRDNGYYKTAGDSEELNQVFEDIFDRLPVSEGSGSPIKEVTQEGELNPGTLTFTDTLGSYMKVSGDTMTVVYGDQMFTSTDKTTADNVDTYHFKGTVTGNTVYKEANLANLTVTVTRSDDLATGDVVTVQIPASLLPMRNYDVDTDAKTMSVTDAYPIRLFYGVSVKADAKTAINQGSGDTYDAIVESNKTDDGKVAFYSNLYNSGNGDTTATFTPSDGNKFYYYTQDTNLYVDQNCTQRATTQNINSYNPLYYSEPYWKITSGNTAQEVTRGIAINRDGQDWSKMTTDRRGNYYIPAGTQRLDRPASLNTTKSNNETGTAETVLTPNWEGTGVVQRLGNNGKITYDLPGKLEIKKSVDWGNASDETKQNQNSFEFTVNFNGDETLEGNFSYDVYESGEDPVRSDKVADGGTIILEAGQRAVIKGLPADTTFTVTENEANKNGFTTTDTVTADPNNDMTDGIASGTIVGGSQQSVSFQNNYMADEPVNLSSETALKVQKTLTGRDWRASDSFSFKITAIDQGPVMSEPTTVQITEQTNQKIASFGDITFNAEGTYRFRIQELSDTEDGITPIAGVDYSGAIYRVTVKVSDAGQGNLKIESVTIEQMTNDQGNQGSGTIQGDTMSFTNTYVSGQATEVLQGTKVYHDKSGGNRINAGKFAFQIEALGGYETGTVEGDASADDYTVAADSDAMPKPKGMTGTTLETGNVGDTFQFPQIVFDGNDVGKTFEYRITELPHQYQSDAEDGMTYDTTRSYVVKIVVSEQDDPDSDEPKVEIVAEPSLQPSQIRFENTYEPTPATTDATGDGAIEGSKVIDGRDLKAGEAFYFTLAQGTITNAANDTTWDDVLDVEGNAIAATQTVSVSDPANLDFAFAPMTFNKVGTYTFTLTETDADGDPLPANDGHGLTYSTESYTVTVTVTDQHDGTLDAAVSYTKMGTEADKAVFTNVYKADMNYGAGGKGGINVTKTMTGGRPMAAGEFQFTLTGEGPKGEVNEQFTNGAAAMDGTVTMAQLQSLTFDQDDAGKTFTFTVDEAEGSLDGVTYDQSQYSVDITVFDNGDGTMHTETTVTKTMNADGSETNKVVVAEANSDAQDYRVPTLYFTNSYEPTSITTSDDTETTLQVTKIVTGAPSPDGVNYSFTLTPADGNPAPVQGDTGAFIATTSGTIAANDSRTVSFGELTFTKAGTYTFTVKETAPQDRPGWTYDTADKTITVEVVGYDPETGEYDGQLHIANVTGNPVKVTNAYQPGTVIVGGEDAEDQIVVQKTVTGYATDTDFTFQLQPVDPDDPKWNNVKRVDSSWDGTATITEDFDANSSKTVTMGGLKFSAIGDYQFTVTEVGSADFNAQNGATRAGWTYDGHTATVTVSVTDDDFDGQLDATVSYDNTKATTDADKAVNNAAAFTNKYEAGPTTLTGSESFTGTKTIEGRNGIDGEKFGFTLKPGDAADGGSWDAVTFQPEGGDPAKFDTANATATMSKGNNTAGFSFDGTFTFSKAGTYTFNVTETSHNGKKLPKDGANGMIYDRHTGTITVKVTDDGHGNLHATATAGEGDASTTFVNQYAAAPATATGETALKLTKEVTGAPALSKFDFNVTLTGGDVNNVKTGSGDGLTEFPADGITVSTKDLFDEGAQQGKQGSETVGFGDITFTAAGDYVFTVTETTTTDKAGWTYASGKQEAKTITVHVTDDGFDGQLDIKTEGGIEGNNPTFTNKYESGFITTGTDNGINVQKTLTGRDWLEGDSFEFVLEAVKDAPMPEGDGNKVTITGKSDPKTAVFDGITYKAAGEYQYTVKETKGKLGGVTYDEHTVNVTVTIADEDYDGSFEVKSVVYDNSDATSEADEAVNNAAAFTNSYSANGSLDGAGNLTVTKNYTSNLGDPWTPDDSFGFVLAADTTDPETQTAVNNGWIELPKNAGSADKAGITIKADTKDYQASFDDIEFTKAGTYKFLVSEVLPDGVNVDTPTKDGITYDTSVKTVTVNVEDNRDGTLTATVADGSDTLTFNNTYNVQPVMFRAAYFALQGNKVLDGRNWEQGDTFTFTMTAGRGTNPDGTQMAAGVVEATMPDKTTDTIEPLADGSKVTDNSAQFTFTDERYPGGDVVPDADDVFTFTQPGTYRYLIAETNPNALNPGSGILGVTYDQTQYRLIVEVKDDGNGNLVVESSKFSSRPTAGAGEWTDIAGDQGITFTNKYSANEVGVSFNAAKVLNGRDTAMNDNEFKFHMAFAGWMSNDDFDAQSEDWKMDGEVAEKAPAPASDKGNIIRGDVIFDNVTFTSDNVGYTYRYAITEVIPDDATNAAYPDVTYGEASAEQKAAAGWTKNGVTYDGSTKYVTAKVTSEQTQDQQNPGTFIEVVRVATGGEAPYNEQTGKFEGGAIFTNTYDAGSTDVDTGIADAQLTKVLTGKAWDDDSFTFKIEAVSNTAGIELADQPMPARTEVKVDKSTSKDKDGNDQATFSFGKISYDTPGEYVYKVTEVAGSNAGIDYSTNEATITVSVKDNYNGGYTTGVTVANNTFTNAYHSELDYNAAGGLEIAKTFQNADMREFSFTVKPADQASADKLGIDPAGETFTTKPGATIGDDNASHAEIMVIDEATEAKFTQDDADDTYTYTVQEVADSDANVDYDDTIYTVTITTADDGQGGIKVTTTVTDGAGYNETYVYDNDAATEDGLAVVPFTNSYAATGELGGNGSTSIKATKTLTNRPMTDGEFTFNVTNANDATGAVVATGTNAADGTVTFGAIDYSIDQMLADVDNGLATPSVVDGKNTFTYQYTVAEDQTNFDEGVTAIAGTFNITVTVTDNGDGTLGIAVAYPDGGDGLTFRNAYGEGEQGQATLNIAGEKKLDVQSGNNAPNIEGKYEFTLTGVDENGNAAPLPATTTAKNDAAGNVTFGDITYTMENVFGDTGNAGAAAFSAERTKTFTYTVTESGTVAGVDNDAEASKTFTVTVTDNGDGTLSAVSDPAQGAKFSFTNTYSVKPTDSSATGKGGITVTKKLTGRDLQDGEFSFELVDHNGQKVAEGTNDADGNVELGAVTFTEPGVYPYTIREVNTALASVDYDAAEHAVTATVTDNGDGTLSVTWKLDGDTPATFTNTYDPVDASVVIGASKVLDGRELKDGEFTFQLTGADESTPMPEDAKDGVSTATNAANGSIGFGTIVYDQAGTYKYTVSEVNDKQDGVTYDDTTYEVTVTVTDNTAEGRLEATVDYGDATALVFTNTYKKAEATIPKTGAAVILPSVIGFILLLGAGGMYASKRRKRS